MTEGPSKIHIPARDRLICNGCIHHKHMMFKSGIEPVYNRKCMHSDFLETNGQIIHTLEVGETPLWCPYLLNTMKNEGE